MEQSPKLKYKSPPKKFKDKSFSDSIAQLNSKYIFEDIHNFWLYCFTNPPKFLKWRNISIVWFSKHECYFEIESPKTYLRTKFLNYLCANICPCLTSHLKTGLLSSQKVRLVNPGMSRKCCHFHRRHVFISSGHHADVIVEFENSRVRVVAVQDTFENIFSVSAEYVWYERNNGEKYFIGMLKFTLKDIFMKIKCFYNAYL